ncbi:SBBP repeat-containing protein, partial [Candidatus Neomarinimicrobiota bacterium]
MWLASPGLIFTQNSTGLPRPMYAFTGGVDTAWVRHYASNLVLSNTRIVDVAADADGNIYLTGASEATFTHVDYVTVKYDSLGNRQWVARYNGPANDDDVPVAMALDEIGNIYVTGCSYGADTHWVFATVKYNADGIQQWAARCTSGDKPQAITVDESGYVYVTGYYYISTDPKSAEGYNVGCTVSYKAGGSERWVARYTGPSGSYIPYAITLDKAGNVYVGGAGLGYEVIKYNSSGSQQWTALHPWLISESSKSLAVDTSGNVYITGSIKRYDPISYAYITVKYNSAGVKQWEATYEGLDPDYSDRANAVFVDDSGDVYVTGISGDFSYSVNFATVKYDPGGVQQWVARLDSVGWQDHGQAATIALDNSGNVYVSGAGYCNYPVVKYNDAGVEQWVTSRHDSIAVAVGMVLDESGNVYIVGIKRDYPYPAGYSAVKYKSSTGQEQLLLRYDGSGISRDEVRAMEIDGAGYIYVAGISEGNGTSLDYSTVKYSADGIWQWAARYNGSANGDDLLEAMTLDDAGNVYVTGGSSDSSGYLDYATVKYNAAGVEQWVATYHGTGYPLYGYDDIPSDIGVDDSGNVYVTGYTSSYNTGTRDYATVKYNAVGVEQWVRYYNGPGWHHDEAVALALDDHGNIYVTGTSEADYLTIKYGPNGTRQWLHRYDYDSDWVEAMEIDQSGNIYVTGFSDGDFVTLKINENGQVLRVCRYSEYIYSTSIDLDWVPEALKTPISVSFRDARLEEALHMIAVKGDLRLSYNRDQLPAEQNVTLQLTDIPALEVLLQVTELTRTEVVLTNGEHLAIVPAETRPGIVMGLIVDQNTGKPLHGANVLAAGTYMGAATDQIGHFSIRQVPPGRYTVQFSMMGYKPEVVETNYDGYEPVELHVRL